VVRLGADMDERRLIEKLRAIDALYARPDTDGERAKHGRELERPPAMMPSGWAGVLAGSGRDVTVSSSLARL